MTSSSRRLRRWRGLSSSGIASSAKRSGSLTRLSFAAAVRRARGSRWYVGARRILSERWTLAQLLGDLVARGTRSSIHAYGRGAVVKVPHASTPADWIESEAAYADAARAVGAPVPRMLGIEQVSGRAASVW